MIIELTSTTGNGRKTSIDRIKLIDGTKPEWSEFHKRWYVRGFRFIKSRGTFSGTAYVHSGHSFTTVEG
jgi:hypothetical protein